MSKSLTMGSTELQDPSPAVTSPGQGLLLGQSSTKARSLSRKAGVFEPPGLLEPAPFFLTYVVFNANFQHMPNSKL